MSAALRYLLLAAASPIIYILDRRIKKRNALRNGDRAPPSSKPNPSKTGLRRPITPPLPESTQFKLGKRPKYKEQGKSPLLAKLPAELRIMIWEYCLSDKVHVYWVGGRMLGQSCVFGDSGFEFTEHRDCYYTHDLVGKAKPSKGDRVVVRGRLALQLTCRRIYYETINPLYSLPVFDFSPSPLCMLHLPKFILPQRMHLITKVDFNWVYYNKVPYLNDERPSWKKRAWLAVWDNITEMQNLKSLNVAMHIGGLDADWQWEEENILRSLEGVRRKKLEHFSFEGLPFEVKAIEQ